MTAPTLRAFCSSPRARRVARPVAASVALLLAAVAPGQADQPGGKSDPGSSDSGKPAAEAGADKADRPAKLTEWPALKPADRERALKLGAQLKKDGAELRETARQELIALGAGTAPLLFQKVNDTERDEDLNGEIFQVFDGALGPEHADLMAAQARKPKMALRTYLVARLCRFVDPDQRALLAWAASDKSNQDNDEVVFCANLGLAALRDTAALKVLLELTRKNWMARKDMVAAVLPAARCADCGTAMIEHIAHAEPGVQAAGLRLLRYVGTKDHEALVRTYLAAEDHNVKKEAVNAMRALNDMEPIENLSAFQAVEMAKEWQSK